MSDPPPPRPKFITVFGWSFLVLSAWSVVAAVLALAGLALIGLFSGADPFGSAAREVERQQGSSGAGFLLRYAGAEMALSVPAGLFTALAAFRLLQMREWARRAFFGILGVLIGVTLIKLCLFYLASATILSQVVADARRWGMASLVLLGFAGVGFQIIAITALLGWCLYQLRRPEIRRGFRPGF